MAQQLDEVQERLGETADAITRRNEMLRRAGVSIPALQNVRPFRAVPLRPKWLAFLLRLVRYPD